MGVWGEAIKALLAERGLTQVELARLAGINRSTVLHIIRGGHCTTDTLAKIATALGVDVAELFTTPLDIGIRRDRMGVTTHTGPPYYKAHPDKMPLSLQDHGVPIRFRNIWIREL